MHIDCPAIPCKINQTLALIPRSSNLDPADYGFGFGTAGGCAAGAGAGAGFFPGVAAGPRFHAGLLVFLIPHFPCPPAKSAPKHTPSPTTLNFTPTHTSHRIS